MKAIINENKTVTISNADIKAIRSAAGFNTDLRKRLYGYNDSIWYWLDEHAEKIFSDDVLNLKDSNFPEYEWILFKAAALVTGDGRIHKYA